ncbi:MAG: phenylalanine--tRNA ligase subunit beta [Candidatus Aenigmatarchaeota archaeon]
MPKIEVSKTDLEALVGQAIRPKDLEELLMTAKVELEGVDPKTGMLKLDCKDTNRPDLWGVEGIARQLRGSLGKETGVPRYDISKANVILDVDRKVAKIRPLIMAAVVRKLRLDDASIQQLIQLQEKVALTWGRKRRDAAIGVYDFDKITPPVRYTTFKDNEIRFIPLDMTEPLSPREILEQHPKGREYGHLITGDDFPILIDSKGNVLSMPPIINSAWTGKVTASTKNVFVEVTGWDKRIVRLALNVVATALAERGGELGGVVIKSGSESITTPDLKGGSMQIDAAAVRKVLGLQLSDDEVVKLLRRARYDVKSKGSKLLCIWPGYRADIMHERDVIEDIGIIFGYNEMQPEIPEIYTAGCESAFESFCRDLKGLAIGLGFQEIMTFVLTNKENLFRKMEAPVSSVAEIANPVSASWSVMRSWLIPSVTEFLSRNMHAEYPQRVFEVGDCVVPDEHAETRTRSLRRLCMAISDTKVGYEQIASVLDALMRNLGVPYKLHPCSFSHYIEGRAAEIVSGDETVGMIGEIHPQVLNNWGIEKAVVAAELSVDRLWALVARRQGARIPKKHAHKIL